MTLYQNSAYKHGVGWSIWHFEWVTKYRYKVFRDEELKKLCGIAFEEAARLYRFRLEDYEIQPEHIHLLVHLRPSMSPSEAVGLIKGYSSRLLFLAANEKLLGYYKWNEGKSLWGDGKFMASVGHITLEKAKEYLEKQETHHANNSTESPPFRVGVEVNSVINHPLVSQMTAKFIFLFIDEKADRCEHLKRIVNNIKLPSKPIIDIDYECGKFHEIMGNLLDKLDKEGYSLAPSFVFIDPF